MRTRLLPMTIALTLCAIILSVRFLTLPFPALIDSTEGRYAAAALTMIEKGDLLTPYIDMGKGPEPYLGKPPMHFWLTVGCFKFLGVSELSARLPSFLATVLSALMIYLFATRVWGVSVAVIAFLIYLSSGLTFFLSGAALLDTTLMLFTTAAITLFGGYYLCGLDSRARLTSILTGAALSGAFLTKGPVSIAIFLAAVIPWAFIYREEVLQKKFPLLTCIISFSVFTAPWYLLCEFYHPGFLYYFIVKENLLRIVSDNYGDRYGSGHPQIFGTSILYVLLCFMPWTVILLRSLFASMRKTPLKSIFSRTYLKTIDSPLMFAATWSLSMPLFLLLTSQYTANYLAPIMPGLALLAASLISREQTTSCLSLPRLLAKVLTTVISIAMVALTIVGLVLGASWWILVPCLIAAGITIFILRNTTLSAVALTRVCCISSVSVALYVSIILSLSAYVSARRSTAEVIALIRGDVGGATGDVVSVGFVGTPPFSSAVYGSQHLPRIAMQGVSNVGEDNARFKYYIVAIKQSATPPESITEVARTRRWIVYRSSTKSSIATD